MLGACHALAGRAWQPPVRQRHVTAERANPQSDDLLCKKGAPAYPTHRGGILSSEQKV